MSFESYAQNFEDVILWRALKHIENGTYVDVGAYDPVEDSVSLAFYQRGWRGVHIEPVPTVAERIRNARTDETVIEAAISTLAGPTVLYAFENTGMTTGVSDL